MYVLPKKAPQRFDTPIKRHPEADKINYDKNVSTKTFEQGTKYYGALKTQDMKKKTGPETSKTLSTEVTRQNPPGGIKRPPASGPKVHPPQLSKPLPTASLVKRKHIAETPVLPSKKKKQAMAKKKAETSNETAPPEYKLSPLLQGCLNKEMKIMLEKIVAAIPEKTDKMPKEDKIVIDILKNRGAQTLTDVLALNVKKRILNVHNPLYAKLQFFKQPPKETIRAIRNTFKLPAMSKVSPKVFAVQFTTLDDFDNFCNMKNIQFEGFNIKINAVYGFTICPPELQSAPIKKKNKGANTTIGVENDNKVQANSSNINASPVTATPKTEKKTATTAVKPPAKVTPNAKAAVKPTPQTPAKLNQQQTNVVKKSTDAAKAKPITPAVLATPTKNTQAKPPIVKNQQLVTKNNVKDNKAKVTNVNTGHDKIDDHVANTDIESILDDVIVLDEC